MINQTSLYPGQTFLSAAGTQIVSQIDTINSSNIPNRSFPKKYGRTNGTAPNGSGVVATQIDVLINPNAQYAFQNLNEARNYALEAANQVVNNPCYYVENNQVANGYYQIVVWGVA